MSLWRADEAARATGGRATGAWQASGVSIDTRTLAPGDLFVALTDRRDGHDFVAQALAQGAAAAMVSRRPEGVAPDAPLLLVEDVQEALEALGRAGRARAQARVVAVTGSVGKTSTKEMLRHVLAAQGPTHAAEASYNNHWGVPLTLARLPREARFAVIEIGMNHPGEIAPLARLARPDVALVTNVAAVHLEAFDDVAAIAAEKAEIFSGLEPGGVAVVNRDVETAGLLMAAAEAAGARLMTFGTGAAADARALELRLSAGATVVRAEIGGEAVLFKLGVPARHLALNALGALAAAQALGADLAGAMRDIATWAPLAGRGRPERLVFDPIEEAALTLIDDAFNANPTSVAAGLEVLAATAPANEAGQGPRGRRIAILGDMLELGPEEEALHAGLAELPALEAADRVHCVGPRMRALWERLPGEQRGEWVASAAEMAARARRLVGPGDVVLVKGSKGSRVSLVVDALRKLGHPLPTAEGGAESGAEDGAG